MSGNLGLLRHARQVASSDVGIFAKCWSDWNLRPERGPPPRTVAVLIAVRGDLQSERIQGRLRREFQIADIGSQSQSDT
jgi:hypothetical protein